jgi:hypothetical protein
MPKLNFRKISFFTVSYYWSILLVQMELLHVYMKIKYYMNDSTVHDNDNACL